MEGKTGRTKGKENTCRTVGITKALADSGHSTARKGFFYFFALKFGYSIETKNPNASPIRKVFGLFVCGRDDRSRTCLNLLPKQAGNRYPTSRYSVFGVKSVSGQICGQKYFAGHEDGEKERKCEENGDFASFRRLAHEAVTRSQSKRVTVTLHPECQKRNCFRHNIIAEAVLFVND